jgi:hypothetical protein
LNSRLKANHDFAENWPAQPISASPYMGEPSYNSEVSISCEPNGMSARSGVLFSHEKSEV